MSEPVPVMVADTQLAETLDDDHQHCPYCHEATWDSYQNSPIEDEQGRFWHYRCMVAILSELRLRSDGRWAFTGRLQEGEYGLE